MITSCTRFTRSGARDPVENPSAQWVSGVTPVLAEHPVAMLQLDVVHGQMRSHPEPTADRPVDHDPEQPATQRRPPLERVDAAQQPDPGVLGDLLHHGPIPHPRHGEPHHRRVEAFHELGERFSVTRAQTLHRNRSSPAAESPCAVRSASARRGPYR